MAKKNDIVLKMDEYNGYTYWVAYRQTRPDLIGQGETREDALIELEEKEEEDKYAPQDDETYSFASPDEFFENIEALGEASSEIDGSLNQKSAQEIPDYKMKAKQESAFYSDDNDSEGFENDNAKSSNVQGFNSELDKGASENYNLNETKYTAVIPKKPQSNKSRKSVIIALIILLALIVAAVVGLIVYLLPGCIEDCQNNAIYSELDNISRVYDGEVQVPVSPVIEGIIISQETTLPQNETQSPIQYQPTDNTLLPIPEKPIFEETPEATVEPSPTPLILPGDYSKYKRNFEKLLKINSDCVGWLEVPGTTINYPVVYSENSQEYLNKDFNGSQNKHGTIFATGTRGIKGRNIVFYGHASASTNTMFSNLKKFRDKSFFNKHNEIIFSSVDGNVYVYKIFAVIEVSIKGHTYNYNQADFSSDIDFRKFIDTAQSLSVIDTGVYVPDGSHTIALSTCVKGDLRLVVMGYR